MTFQQWVEKYQRKTKEQFFVPDGFHLAFDEEHGFFCFTADYRDGVIFINISHTCVDSWKWVLEQIIPLAKAIGATHLATATNRNPEAYAKLTGGIRKPEYDYDDYKVFVMEVPDV